MFRPLQNAMNDENFLNSKPNESYMRLINKLPDKWQEVNQNNGEYTIDSNQCMVK